MTPHEQKQLDDLMDGFEFRRVARAMKALKWHWASYEDRVPDEAHIRKWVREQAQRAIHEATTNTGYKPGKGFVGTGGFHIEAFTENGALTGLYVRFTLTEYSNVP